MRDFARSALSVGAAAASLAGCTMASQSTFTPPGSSQAPVAREAYSRSLLYVASSFGSTQVFGYPHGKSIGFLGVGGYICSDTSGNIFITGAEGLSYVWIFAHGSEQPLATLYNPQSPGGCSVDKSSENLAVANADGSPIVVFPYNRKRGWRLARQYNVPDMRASLYCSYDPQGDLFIDGVNTSISFMLVELPKGSSTFTTITLDQPIQRPGSMQWVGKDLAIEDAGASGSGPAVIYTFAISGSNGHKVSATTLEDSESSGQFLIRGGNVMGPRSYSSERGVGVWRFPNGGNPIRTIATYAYPTGEALSFK